MRMTGRLCVACAVCLSVASVATAGNDRRLAEAVKSRDTAAAVALLQQHVDPNTPLPDGATALHWAVRWNDLEIADQLIRAGADVNATNRYGVTPLVLACTNGSAAMTQALLRAGADPHASPKGEPLIMTAARTGDAATVKVLLASGASVNAVEADRGQTALMWAAAEGHSHLVQLLIDHGAEIHARSTAGYTALLFAVRRGDIESARLLLAAGANPNATVPDAVRYKEIEIGTGPDRRGGPLLLMAISNAHYEVAALLLMKGADSNATDRVGRTALHLLVTVNNPTQAFYYRPPPVPTGTLDSVGLMRALLAHGAYPNARLGREEPSVLASPDAPDPHEGATPFWLAAEQSDVQAMRILAAGGSDVRLPTKDGTTPLMVAARGGFGLAANAISDTDVLDVVKLALDLGSDLHARNARGQTALHGAVFRGVRGGNGADAVIQLLAEHGAKLDAKDAGGQTPEEFAETFPQTGIARERTLALLRKLGGNRLPE